MKPNLPHPGPVRRAIALANALSNAFFEDDMVIITSNNSTEEKVIGFRLIKGQNLAFIMASTSLPKHHIVNRMASPCPACAHGIPLKK